MNCYHIMYSAEDGFVYEGFMSGHTIGDVDEKFGKLCPEYYVESITLLGEYLQFAD